MNCAEDSQDWFVRSEDWEDWSNGYKRPSISECKNNFQSTINQRPFNQDYLSTLSLGQNWSSAVHLTPPFVLSYTNNKPHCPPIINSITHQPTLSANSPISRQIQSNNAVSPPSVSPHPRSQTQLTSPTKPPSWLGPEPTKLSASNLARNGAQHGGRNYSAIDTWSRDRQRYDELAVTGRTERTERAREIERERERRRAAERSQRGY